MYLSKSDFKIARTCPTKLFYKKEHYPSRTKDDPYLAFLADGGYMVEEMAKLLYPKGREMGHWDDPIKAFAETKKAVQSGGVLFESTVLHGKMMARMDILEVKGNTLRLIEVKSSSVNSEEDGSSPFRGARGGIKSTWRPYLEDVAFQAWVLGNAFPDLEIIPMLCLVDKAQKATADSIYNKFHLIWQEGVDGRSCASKVEYTGHLEGLRDSHLLAFCDVSSEVSELATEVEEAAASFASSIKDDRIKRIPTELGQQCQKCEYRLATSPGKANGFEECWGALAKPDPHILDLYRIDLAGGKNCNLVGELAARGTAALQDIPEDRLSGATAVRQILQLKCDASGKEFIDPELRRLLSNNPGPLHFIDFEASRLAIPYHEEMRPYELAVFQWSCHTIAGHDGGASDHAEWLNDEEVFPNFAFVHSLRKRIGDRGTVYIWSHYEIDVLKEVRRQMDDYGHDDDALKSWLEELTEKDDARIIDLYKLAKDYYIHPEMKGSLSIKDVLPAVWHQNPGLQEVEEFRKYVSRDEDGRLLNPYDVLSPLPIGEEEEVIKEGTAAMRTYQEMMFGRFAADPEARGNYRQILLQYCELDTAAMVMIWRHWAGIEE